MDKTEENKTTEQEVQPVYPEATKGSLSDDHSTYAAPKQWAGGDPDTSMRAYFIAFMLVMGVLFILAVKSLAGSKFIF